MAIEQMRAPGEIARFVRPTAEDWDVCQQTARTFGKSFYLASRALPHERRQAVRAAYAYCRMADDIVDRAADEDVASVDRALDRWERQLAAPEHPVAIAFASARETYGIPDQPIHDLLRGLRQDLTVHRYETWQELHEYCYLVAGTVGLIVAPILGCRDAHALPHAANLGIAMQLTNILRDVAEDAEMGRVYLPREELAQFGVTPEGIVCGRPGPDFPSLMQVQIARARSLYASAFAGVPALCPSGRFATLAAAELYAGILDEIERLDYDVFRRRAVTSRATKARKLSAAVRHFARMSMPVHVRALPSGQRVAIDDPSAASGEQVALSLASSTRTRS